MDRGRLAHALREAVGRVAGVSRLVADGPVETAAHYPGGTVPGVGLCGDELLIRIAVTRLPVEPVASQAVRAARRVLDQAGDDRPVHVVVADIDIDRLEPVPLGTDRPR